MSDAVQWHDHGDIRVIVTDNPPVNALGFEVRSRLAAALRTAEADAGIRGIVLATAGRTYFGGADIREFSSTPRSPRVFDLVEQMDGMSKPIIAAIKGQALGGGLEMALACHWRVATPDANLGFPEVKLGLIPGAGGTQRTPRLIGVAATIDLVTSGIPIKAGRALELGLIDAIADGVVEDFAITFLRACLAENRPLRRSRDLPVTDADTNLSAQKAAVAKQSRHMLAPLQAIEAVEAGLAGDFDAGIIREKAIFKTLMEGEQSRALRHVFLSERAAAQVPGLGDLVPEKVERVAVVGAGTMGRGIAIAFLNSGFAVTLLEPQKDVLAAAASTVKAALHQSVAKGRMTAAAGESALERFTAVEGDASKVGIVDLVVEAALEDMALKKAIFGELDRHAPSSAILATNTSTLDVNAIAAATSRPDRVLGLHFFSPANIMRLLEVVRGKKTSDQTLATSLTVAKALRKQPVVVGVCDGFVGNRMLAKRHVEAERLLLEGALPEEVDAAWTAFGFPMGPFAMTDLAGVDTNWRVRQSRGAALAIHDAIYAMGRYGQKTGKGFYRYEPSDRTPLPDPEITALIEQASSDARVERRSIPADEILERLLFPMINEGACLLEEGIARSAGDIDVVWVNGYGWPAWRGGPMFHADSVGLARVRDRLADMHAASGNPDNVPAPLLVELASQGGKFLQPQDSRA